jgi:hypothetical protein
VSANASSPASTGPAGSLFEVQVGAHYLLSLLTDAEPRGLPATQMDRVAMQRAAEGNPLDDVIVFAHDLKGSPAILEIQVKRSITFAPADPIFRSVVDQVAEASRKPEFLASRYELAIAVARTSQKITGPYQDVLTWARQLGDASTFMSRISRPGSASDDMRSFVRTFQAHLATAGAPSDDQTVWALLRRLQILGFDFTASGSASEQLARERCVRALRPDDSLRAAELWVALVELSLEIAASGGDRTRPSLVADLGKYSFRLEGSRRFFSARATLAEASRNTLADIDDRVGSLILTRHEHVAAVHAALDAGRYIEIRGDGGVGKSGVLKHFAEQYTTEGPVIVLSPNRTIPSGWLAMRAVLGFDGTAHDLLHVLAGNSGAALLVDNLDFFVDAERRTVSDLVRTAAEIPGFVVITTARTNFGLEEPNWLPADALDRLGRTEPVIIGELSDGEVEEIRHAEPTLAPLLVDNHPAHDVTRNLFRLARLAHMSSDQIPRTEAAMAMQWWQTADGKHDEHWRDRARVLRAIAEQALLHAGPLDVKDLPAAAIDALVASESLRDLGNDRVAFRHDVLREWAVANILNLEPEAINRLPLDRSAPLSLSRGIELAARMAIERAADSTQWDTILNRVSRESIHGSWRRAVLLSLLHSEASSEILTRASHYLLADRAAPLRELIRIVMAVDVRPAAPVLTAAGLDPSNVPPNLHLPSGPSWYRLINWLLELGPNLPAPAIPESVSLFTAWSLVTLGFNPLTQALVQRLYAWLREIETARYVETFRALRQPFGGKLSSDQIDSLESDLRTAFLLLCSRVPELAAEYLRLAAEQSHNDRVVRSILTFRGTLTQGAPAELAELTLKALSPADESEDDLPDRDPMRGPFSFLDNEFIPASPAQGPFFELLMYATKEGLALIRALVDQSLSFYTGGRTHGSNAITIPLPNGDALFPWTQSYMWSRFAASSYCVTSGLMALEAWAHRRIEAAEPFERVLTDVLGTDAPAAYVLVAVDLILSHWPESQEAAIPFLASPELLCLDRQRVLQDNFESPDLLGIRALEKEPSGSARLDDLKKQPSRRFSLEQLIGQYAVTGPREQCERLTELLLRAGERLGAPDDQSDLGDPRLMVVHALNLANPKNWREVATTLPNGTSGTCCEYQAPETEARHLAALQEAARERSWQSNMLLAVGAALDNPSRSSPQFAAAAAEWAQQAQAAPPTADEGAEDRIMRERAIIAAATIAMRDGEPELRLRSEAWAREIFASAAHTNEDRVLRFQSQLRFNALGTAFVGIARLLRSSASPDDVRALLELAGRGDPAVAHGFGVSISLLVEIDQRLPRSLLRCAFTAAIRPRHKWNTSDEEMTSRAEGRKLAVQAAVSAELDWLANQGSEPEWPEFLIEPARPRSRIYLSPRGVRRGGNATDETDPDYYVDHQSSALWLSQIARLGNATSHPWKVEIARAYTDWTASANGAGLDAQDEVDDPPQEWNEAYFNLLTNCLPALTLDEIGTLSLEPIRSLPDEVFFDVVTIFQRSVDAVYFNDRALEESTALHIRAVLADRLTASRGWNRIGTGRLGSIETHIGPPIAALFFNDYGLLTPAKCYLLPEAIGRIDSFLPMLERLVRGGPSLFVALVTLNLLEVSPDRAHAAFLLAAAESWLQRYPSEIEFWVDHGIGRRFCLWIDGVRQSAPDLVRNETPLRSRIIRLVAALVNLGVAEAKHLEEALVDDGGSPSF